MTDISYYDAGNNLLASEGYSYDEWNQVTTHTLPSGAPLSITTMTSTSGFGGNGTTQMGEGDYIKYEYEATNSRRRAS